MSTLPDWVDALDAGAPDIVAAWRGIEAGRLLAVRREVRRRGGAGSAEWIAAQLAILADALADDRRIAARRGTDPAGRRGRLERRAGRRPRLRIRARACASRPSLAARGRWPAGAPSVVPGIPGAADADRPDAPAQDRPEPADRRARGTDGRGARDGAVPAGIIRRSGRLRCGEWLVFAGVHDLMHLEQLHDLLSTIGTRVVSPFRPDLVDCWIYRRRARDGPGDPAPPAGARPDPAGPLAVRLGVARGRRAGRGRRPPGAREETGFDARRRSRRSSTSTSSTSSTSRRWTPSSRPPSSRSGSWPGAEPRLLPRARRRPLARRSTTPIARSSGPATAPRSSGSATTCSTRTAPPGSS